MESVPSNLVVGSPKTIEWTEFENTLDSLIDECRQYYKRDKLFLAYEKVLLIEHNIRYHEEKHEGLDKERLNSLKIKMASDLSELFSKIKKEYTEVQKLLQDFYSEKGWSLQRDSDNVKTWYKHEESAPIYSIKMEGIVESPIFNILAMAYEDDLYTTWVPMLKESRRVYFVSGYRKVVYLRSDLPWPIWSRDACMDMELIF